jgi:hypothetical protein
MKAKNHNNRQAATATRKRKLTSLMLLRDIADEN